MLKKIILYKKGNYLESISFKNDFYKTAELKISLFAKLMPSIVFYTKLLLIILRSSHKAKRNLYDTSEWFKSSMEVLRALESVGVKINISGIDNFKNLKESCVFIANHMSTLETFVLPCIIAPFKEVTFVVKKSLVDYPIFGHIMRSRDPITVTRKEPRKDLLSVLEKGSKKLKSGVSIVIFPQTTRTTDFNPSDFNSIGIKLARKAEVPVIPIALKTDAWRTGRYLKDFGRINPKKTVYFSFGKPLKIDNKGIAEHQDVIKFISQKLTEWSD